MKTTLLLIFLITLAFCEKLDETYCYDCHIKFYWQRDNILLAKDTTVIKCDYSELDAQKFENQRTCDPYPISACNDVRWSECMCEKRNISSD